MRLLIRIPRSRIGTSGAEYALILAVIGGALALAAIVLGDAVGDSMNEASGVIDNCGGGC